jgi:hypothetical protein
LGMTTSGFFMSNRPTHITLSMALSGEAFNNLQSFSKTPTLCSRTYNFFA